MLNQVVSKTLTRPGTRRVVPPLAVEPIVADPLEALGQDVLHHAPDEPQDRQRLVLDRLAAMVPAPRSSEAGPLVLARLRLRPPRCGRLPPR